MSKSASRITPIVYFLGFAAFSASLLGNFSLAGLKWIGIAAVLAPALKFSLWDNGRRNEKLVLASVFGALVPLSLLYYVKNGYPVGFSDVHVHMFETETLFTASGNVNFVQAQSIPFSFVALYIESRFLELFGSLSIVQVATLLPPLLNLGTPLIVYAIVRRVTNPRVSMLTLLFFSWENNTLVFGDEFRTQNLGTLCTLSAVLIYVIQTGHGGKSRWTSLAALLVLLALSTTSFVSAVFAFWFFGAVIIADFVTKSGKPLQNAGQFVIMNVFVLGYLFYISESATSVIGTFVILFRDAFSQPSVTTTTGGQTIYGPVVQWFVYGLWGLAGLFGLLLTRWGRLRNGGKLFSLLCGLGAVFVFATVASTLVPFSAGRGYTLGALLVGIVLSMGFLEAAKRISRRHRGKLRIVACLIVVTFAVVSVAKLPAYLAGDMAPVRGHELIDDVPYWRVDTVDFAAAEHLDTKAGNQVLYLHMLISPYMLLATYATGLREPPPSLNASGGIIPGSLVPGGLVLLRDRVGGEGYAYRWLLPPVKAYNELNQIYSDGDYILYLVPTG